MPSYTRDSTFYCPNIILLVEDTLFCVPRDIFQESQVFQDMWRMPQSQSESVPLEGSDDEHPLVLSSYLANDMRQLLRVLLPRYPPEQPQLTSDQWMSVLKLSTAWDIGSVRATAMKELEKRGNDDPILRILVAKQYDVPGWFVPALNRLAQRDSALDENDIDRLLTLGSARGVLRFAVKMAQLRETLDDEPSSPIEPCILKNVNCQVHHATSIRFCSTAFSKRRAAHDFTAAIRQIFNCVEDRDGRAEGEDGAIIPGPLLPQESSWDFI